MHPLILASHLRSLETLVYLPVCACLSLCVSFSLLSATMECPALIAFPFLLFKPFVVVLAAPGGNILVLALQGDTRVQVPTVGPIQVHDSLEILEGGDLLLPSPEGTAVALRGSNNSDILAINPGGAFPGGVSWMDNAMVLQHNQSDALLSLRGPRLLLGVGAANLTQAFAELRVQGRIVAAEGLPSASRNAGYSFSLGEDTGIFATSSNTSYTGEAPLE